VANFQKQIIVKLCRFLAVQGAKSDVKKQATMSPSLAKQVLQMLGLIEALEMQFKSGYT
jgi:hypothetical protein